uniref:Uncharacterized protein n=1 Tax=Glossina austeni TaxID=7395 RepID=A0A1A9UTT7_GLOAU
MKQKLRKRRQHSEHGHTEYHDSFYLLTFGIRNYCVDTWFRGFTPFNRSRSQLSKIKERSSSRFGWLLSLLHEKQLPNRHHHNKNKVNKLLAVALNENNIMSPAFQIMIASVLCGRLNLALRYVILAIKRMLVLAETVEQLRKANVYKVHSNKFRGYYPEAQQHNFARLMRKKSYGFSPRDYEYDWKHVRSDLCVTLNSPQAKQTLKMIKTLTFYLSY